MAHTEVCLKCRGLELALRFLGRFAAQEFHAFYAGFCRFLSNFGEMFEPSLPQPTRFTEAVRCPSRRVSAVCALAAAGCVELNKMIRAKIKNELSKQLEQVKYAAYGDDFYAVGVGLELIQRSVRDGDPFEAEASALMDADVNAGHGPAFAGKTDFAERDQILAHGQIAQRGDQRERRGHIGGRLVQPQAACDAEIHVLRGKFQSQPFFQHGKQQRQAVVVDAGGHPPRRRINGRRRQRLDFGDDGAAAFDHTDRAASRHVGLPLRHQQLGGILHLAQSVVQHLKNADFICRAETVFRRADDAENVLLVSLKI